MDTYRQINVDYFTTRKLHRTLFASRYLTSNVLQSVAVLGLGRVGH